jgi:hypothetical protein
MQCNGCRGPGILLATCLLTMTGTAVKANDDVADAVESTVRRPEFDEAQPLGEAVQALPPGPAGPIPPFFPIEPVSHPDPNVLERSHLFPLLNGVILDAQIAPHLFMFDSFERLYGPPRRGRARRAVAWSFTPMIRVRILNVSSSPVKTLSWMPKMDVQLVSVWRTQVPATQNEHARALTLHATVGHHSNGQDEWLYRRGLADDDMLCPPPASVKEVTINYPNGSFSTNYLRFGGVHKWMVLAPKDGERIPVRERIPIRTLSLGAYYEVNPRWLRIGGVLPDVIRPLYGGNRVRGIAEFETRLGKNPLQPHRFWGGTARLTATVERISKIHGVGPLTSVGEGDTPLAVVYRPGNGSSPWRFVGEAAWNPDWSHGWGIETRYVHGQDYYNIQFIRNIHWFQLGVVFDAGEFQRFLTKGGR